MEVSVFILPAIPNVIICKRMQTLPTFSKGEGWISTRNAFVGSERSLKGREAQVSRVDVLQERERSGAERKRMVTSQVTGE